MTGYIVGIVTIELKTAERTMTAKELDDTCHRIEAKIQAMRGRNSDMDNRKYYETVALLYKLNKQRMETVNPKAK